MNLNRRLHNISYAFAHRSFSTAGKWRSLRALAALLVCAVLLTSNAVPAWAESLSAPSGLNSGQTIFSSSLQHRLIMQADGNLVVYLNGSIAAWSSGTSGSGNFFRVQADGNLVVYSANGTSVWQSGTAGSGSGGPLIMQDDGNLVEYNSSNQPVWSSATVGDTLPAGARLYSGQYLISPSRRVKVIMQNDGNFVAYGNNNALWSTGTSGQGNYAVMQSDGNLVIYNSANQPKWSSGSSGSGNRLIAQDDGNAVVYSAAGVAAWQSGSSLPAPYYYNYCANSGVENPHYSSGNPGQFLAKWRATCPVDATIWQVTVAILRCTAPSSSTCNSVIYNSSNSIRNIPARARKQVTVYGPPVGTPLDPGPGYYQAEALYCPQPDMNVQPPCLVQYSGIQTVSGSNNSSAPSAAASSSTAPSDRAATHDDLVFFGVL